MTLDIPPLPGTAILHVEVGSGAYGTGLDEVDDQDETVVYLESRASVFAIGHRPDRTVMHRTQPEGTRSGPDDIDRTDYSLRKFVNLTLQGNPTMLATLWCPALSTSGNHLYNALGQELLDRREMFLGRHIIPRFRGYARGQALRLLGLKGNGHGLRGGGKREELIAAHGYDTKYAMHTARLGLFCVELLTTRDLRIPVHASSILRRIRRGEVPFQEWLDLVAYLDRSMDALYDDPEIPEGPNLAAIEQWTIEAHERAWEYQDANL